jgi:glutamate/tyrosine decarboxylase-like PLP-dependent enzyme
MIAGVGTSELEVVPADAAGRLQPSRLPSLDRHTLLILQAGNIYTGAFDAFAEIVPAARRAGAWVHVDGAFGLWAAASPSTRPHTAGIDEADSWSADCHKTLNTPYSCGLFICRDREAVQTAMASQGSYLSLDDHRNGMDYSPDMARRCFAAEVWATLKFLGRDGVATLVETLVDRARAIALGLEASGYIVMNDVVFNQVTVRLDDDAQTEAALGHLQREGRAWCSGGSWLGHRVIRISVSSWRTTPADVTATIEAFDRARLAAAG